jgi:hypothetical protein
MPEIVGYCEHCGLEMITVEMYKDIENRLCYECADYSESSAMDTDEDESDSEIDDPTYEPPADCCVEWSD